MATLGGCIGRVRRALGAAVAIVGAAILLASPLGAAELLMFEEPGCPWCERWRAEVGVAYPNTSEGRRAPLRRIDLRAARNVPVALSAPVVVSPTFVLVDNDREIGRITGYPGADFFWGLLAQLVAKLDRGAYAPLRSGLGVVDRIDPGQSLPRTGSAQWRSGSQR